MIQPGSHFGATILNDIPIRISREDVYRSLGYGRSGGRPDAGTAGLIESLIARGTELARPRAIYRIWPVASVDAGHVELEGGARFRGAIGQYIGPASHVALFVATVGPEIEAESQRQMRDGNLLEGAVLDAVGSDGAERAAEAVSATVAADATAIGPQFATTPRYSPGYCGMHLTQQRTLFGAIDAAAVGVSVSEVCLMSPIKSVSGLIGIGERLAVDDIGTPCQRCGKTDCMMRRE
ncbi:MAG: hypothetical protein BIFFINMI_01269 [Phycisphaerae bacterium]|nr:hypothetical protein [Phycisphaerae bacterium]